ncbi:MAG: drug/metabolite transporter (DMT)-like permease, partial [bacterium]
MKEVYLSKVGGCMNFLRYRNYGWMLIATILIATSFPVGFAITQSLNSIVLIFIRFLFASILFVPILIWKSQLFLPSWKDLSRYSILSFVVVGFFWCMFESLKYTTAINTGVIYTVVPGIAGIYEWFLLKNKFTLKRFIALILGVIGSACVIVQGNFSQIFQMQWNRGDLIFLVGCLFMGIYTPLVKFLHRKEPIIV